MICCEGNAAFYEVGAMAAPLEGWNMTHTCLPVATQCLAEVSVRFLLVSLDLHACRWVLCSWLEPSRLRRELCKLQESTSSTPSLPLPHCSLSPAIALAQPVCCLPIPQGLPFPSQEANAIDVVVRYAVTELGFPFEDIILYAWSIGECLQGPQHRWKLVVLQ